MTRAVSWNWEIQVDNVTIYPSQIGEFGEGEEGRIKVADGDRKYNIRDQIFDIDEIPLTVLKRAGVTAPDIQYTTLQDWCLSGGTKDVYLIARDAGKNERMKFLCSNTQLAMGKLSQFDRKGKTELTKKFHMIPEDVEEIPVA